MVKVINQQPPPPPIFKLLTLSYKTSQSSGVNCLSMEKPLPSICSILKIKTVILFLILTSVSCCND